MSNIKIAFSCGDEYSKYLIVTITSILKNSDETDQYTFFVLDGGISEQNKDNIRSLTKIRPFTLLFKDVDQEKFKTFFTSGHYSPVLYYKFLLPEILSTEDKVMYLDCDTLVIRNIADFWNINIDSYCLAAVEDLWPRVATGIYKRKDGYVNTGILLINCKKWRERHLTQTLLEYSQQNDLMWLDQDAVNDIVPYDDILRIDFKWNIQATYVFQDCVYRPHPAKEAIIQARKKPFIIHYLGEKPWKNAFVPFGGYWYWYKSYVLQITKSNFFASLKYRLFASFLLILPFIRKYIVDVYQTNRGTNIKLFGFIKTKICPKRKES